MARDPNLQWIEVDVSTLSPKNKKLYDVYKKAQAAASEARSQFEAEFEKTMRGMEEVIDSEQTLLITHNFGKLSFAVKNEPPKAKGGKREKFSFKG